MATVVGRIEAEGIGESRRDLGPLFVGTIFVGSFLLFLVQPMIARMALPRLGGAPAVDAWLALGVEPPPPEAAVQVLTGDRVETLVRVDRLDAPPDVEAVVLGLERLVGVERRVTVDRPLAVGPAGARRPQRTAA